MLGVIFGLVFCVCLTVGSFADSLWTTGVRTRALGYAVAASDLGLESALKNPATLSAIRHTQWRVDIFDDYNGDAYAGVYGLGYQMGQNAVAIQVPYQYIGQIPLTSEGGDGKGQQSGETSDSTFMPVVTWSHLVMEGISVGVSGKGLYQTLNQSTATGAGIDLGMLVVCNDFRVAASIQNIWSTKRWKNGSEETMGKRITLGSGLTLTPDMNLLGDWNYESGQSTCQVGLTLALAPDIHVMLGLPNIADPSQFHLGVDLGLSQLALTLAYEFHSVLGQSYILGVRYEN